LSRTRSADRIRIGLVLASIVLASTVHYVTPPSVYLWHVVFQRIYYLPIVFAAISFGWQGGVAAAILSALSYIPHIAMAWEQSPEYRETQYAEIVIFFLVGIVTGLLADREQEQKRQLEQMADQLSKLYRELQDSFEQLKRADRLSAIGQLSASIAHEIRNPLASIEGAVNVLSKPETDEEVRHEFREIIRKECRRLNQLLTNLLDFARPRMPQYREAEVGQLLDSVISLVVHAAGQSGVSLRKDLSADLPRLECDSEQLQQVILNLVMNAIQAMPSGGEVSLAVRQRDSNIQIEVTDQGVGIAEEDLGKIFDPFFSTKKGGTGLGLSVAHRIVSQHNGALTAKRNADKGMTFSVLIPIHHR